MVMTDLRLPAEPRARGGIIPERPSQVTSSALRWTGFGGCLLLIVFVAFYVRYLFFLMWGGTDANYLGWADQVHYGTLSHHYVQMANALLASFTGQTTDLLNGDTAPSLAYWGAGSLAIYPPGYPIFLALTWMAGLRELHDIRLVQAVVDALATVPLAFLLRRLGASSGPSLVGAGLYALSPWLARGCTFILAEAMMPALVVCVLLLMMRWKERSTVSRAIVLGFVASILPMFRPDMLLVIFPLLLWSAFNAPQGRKIALTSILIAAFAVLPVCWGFFNLTARGFFVLTSNAGWYAAWSGLGMIANPYGYYTYDGAASEEVRAHGIAFLSPESEAYWRAKYFQAWREHPLFVLETILFRFRRIPSEFDYIPSQFGGHELIGTLGAGSLVLVLLVLLARKRYAHAFIVAGPMAYALLSLGFLYVESRYVRYASISYLLSIPLLLQLLFEGWLVLTLRASASLAVVVASFAFISYVRPLVSEARGWVFGAAMRTEANLPTRLAPSDLSWKPGHPGGDVSVGTAGSVRLTTSTTPGDFYIAPIRVAKDQPFYIRVMSQLDEGQLTAVVYNHDPPLRHLGPSIFAWAPAMKLFGHSGDPSVWLVVAGQGGRFRLTVTSIELAVGGCREDWSDWFAQLKQALNPHYFCITGVAS